MSLLLAALVGWPPIHMALSSHCGFSPWKYFGWGMYATPYSPKNQIVHVYVVPKTPVENLAGLLELAKESDSWLFPARLQMSYGVFQWRGSGFAPLATTARARQQSAEVKRLKVLGGVRAVAELAGKIEREHRLSAASWKMLVLSIQPRSHPLARMTYAEVDAYLYEDGQVEELGTYRTDESDLAPVLAGALGQAGLH